MKNINYWFIACMIWVVCGLLGIITVYLINNRGFTHCIIFDTNQRFYLINEESLDVYAGEKVCFNTNIHGLDIYIAQ